MQKIIELAQSRGSTSKTISGAKKYLLQNLPKPIFGLQFLGKYQTNYKYRQTLKDFLRSKSEMRAAKFAARLGYPDCNAEYTKYCDAYVQNSNFNDFLAKSSKFISISEALTRTYTTKWDAAHTFIKISRFVFAKIAWDEESDWNYYSKSYGRPKNTYSNRRVEIREFIPGEGEKLIKNYPLESFKGNFLEKVFADFTSN